jgi:hypothetical protein
MSQIKFRAWDKGEKEKLIKLALKKAIRLYFGRMVSAADSELRKIEKELKL